jgi:hypothetical protein
MKNLALIAALVLSFIGSKVAFADEAAAANVKCEINGEVKEMPKADCEKDGGKVQE